MREPIVLSTIVPVFVKVDVSVSVRLLLNSSVLIPICWETPSITVYARLTLDLSTTNVTLFSLPCDISKF